jgi:hypothetical protein
LTLTASNSIRKPERELLILHTAKRPKKWPIAYLIAEPRAIEIEEHEVRLAEPEAGAAAKSKLCVRVISTDADGI